MKTPFVVAFLFSIATGLHAQTGGTPPQQQEPPQDTPWSIVSRDAHNNIWERTTYETTPDGQVLPHLHHYQETATGLNFWNADTSQWEASAEEIDQYQGGAIAQHGQHKVIFASDLATFGAIDMQMPDGQELRSHLLGLSYYDQATRQSVLIAQVTNSIGQIITPNQIWYDGAFTGLKAGVRYTYTRDGFEQDVILEERPLPPESYGLNSATTVLQALTEFISPPTPAVSTDTVPDQPGNQMTDQTVHFSTMQIGRGRAFLIGDDSQGTPVCKEWTQADGRQFLIEEVPISQIAGQLQTLPQIQSASLTTSPNSVVNVVSRKRLLPPQPVARISNRPMTVVSLPPAKSGFVLDYSALNTSQTNRVFQADTTYYVTGNTTLYGTNTYFEGGTVFKFASGYSLTVNTPVSWQAAPYRPVVMLAKDDNSAGEILSGSTGNPGHSYYATKALYFDGTSALTNLVIQNLRIANAQSGVVINGQTGHVLTDVQLINCGNGIAATNTDFSLHNALLATVLTNFTGNNATGHVEHLTSDIATYLYQNIGANLFLTNSLMVNVTNIGSWNTDHVASVSGGGIFQTANPGGFHYLAANSPYRDIGTTNISAAMLADLKQKTTYPPIVFSNQTFSIVINFSRQALRDIDTPDYGYHYDPLDYVFGGCNANSNMTFSAGTAVGWFHASPGSGHAQQGLHIGNQQTVSFNGTATAPTYWARCNAVQEQDSTGVSGIGGITSWASQSGPYTNAAIVIGQFLRSIAVGDWSEEAFRDDSGFLIGRFTDCEFYSCGAGSYVSTYFFTNCLFFRDDVGTWQGSSGNEMRFQNCTFHGGYIYLEPSTTLGITVKDSSFENTAYYFANLANNASYATYDYNAYTNGTDPFPLGGTHDQHSVTYNWQTGPLGNFYLPTNSILINTGSVTADLVGLYHFTTQTNQVKETNSQVDIGYHYVALDSSGNPVDTDGDGVPDYIEDVNGNGTVDTGERDWQTSENGTTGVSGLQVFTILK